MQQTKIQRIKTELLQIKFQEHQTETTEFPILSMTV